MSDSTGKYSTLKRSGSEENLQKANGNNWTESLETLLADSAGKLAFAAFLQDEYSIENLNFLMAAGRFSKLTNLTELKGCAEQLIFKFIGAKSETPVNLSAAIETGI